MPLAALRADREIARRGYARYAAYRVATLAGLFTMFGQRGRRQAAGSRSTVVGTHE